MPLMPYLPLIIFITASMLISYRAGKLTLYGTIAGGMLAIMIYAGAGYTGFIMLSAFFAFGTITTSWKRKEKQHFKTIADRSVKRTAGQVIANGGMAALAGLLVYLIPAEAELCRLMMAASLASAMADTLSSELGMIYGRNFYNVISWKRDEKGQDGVISLQGILIGIAGSTFIAVIYAAGFGWGPGFALIIIAGTAGNLADSVLGALLERKLYIGNDTVNFLNTFIAAGVVALLYSII